MHSAGIEPADEVNPKAIEVMDEVGIDISNQLHIGFDDPSNAIGTNEFVMKEFCRVRDEIKEKISEFFSSH